MSGPGPSPTAVLAPAVARTAAVGAGEVVLPVGRAPVRRDRDAGPAIAVAATLASAALLWALGALAPMDARLGAMVAAVPLGHHAARALRVFAALAPYYGAAFVVVALVAARGRGASVAQLADVVGMLVVGLVLAHGVKVVCWRARPVSPLDGVQLDSFPSGHTASVAFCVAAALQLLALSPTPRDRWWRATAVGGALATIAIGAARVFLQRHWPTDVLAAILMAVAFWGSAGPSTPWGRRAWSVLAIALGVASLLQAHVVLPAPGARVWQAPAAGRMRLRPVDPAD